MAYLIKFTNPNNDPIFIISSHIVAYTLVDNGAGIVTTNCNEAILVKESTDMIGKMLCGEFFDKNRFVTRLL